MIIDIWRYIYTAVLSTNITIVVICRFIQVTVEKRHTIDIFIKIIKGVT